MVEYYKKNNGKLKLAIYESESDNEEPAPKPAPKPARKLQQQSEKCAQPNRTAKKAVTTKKIRINNVKEKHLLCNANKFFLSENITRRVILTGPYPRTPRY